MNEIEILVKRYPELLVAKDDILKAYKVLRDCYGCGGKLLIEFAKSMCSRISKNLPIFCSTPPSRLMRACAHFHNMFISLLTSYLNLQMKIAI